MKKITVAILLVTAASFLTSCGSKPAEEPEETPEAPVVEVQEEVKEEIPVVEEVQEEPEPEPEPEPVDNSSSIEAIDDIRDEVIDAGAEDKAADILSKLDAEFEKLKNSETDVSEEAQQLINKYKILLDYLNALEAKEEIDTKGFASYDQLAYDQGIEAFEGLKDALMSDQSITSELSEKAQKAYSSFNSVLITAYKKLARAERDAAYKEKVNADSVKAGVSQKEKYSKAVQSFQIGDSCYSMQNAERSIVYYQEAKEAFAALYKDVSEKRAAAQAAINSAKKRVEESANYAAEADSKSPVTKQIEGIEDEDAVLLEEDVYENPDDAEVEIAAKLEGEEYDEEEDTEEDLILESILFDDEEEFDEVEDFAAESEAENLEEEVVVEETETDLGELEAEDEESSEEEDEEEVLEDDSEENENETSEDEADDEDLEEDDSEEEEE